MKAWLLERLGGLEHLRLAEVPDPQPGQGEVLVEILYAALNPADRYLAEGQYPAHPPMPHVLGRDGVGLVRTIGAGVTSIKTSDKLAILRGEVGVTRPGTFAQRVIVPVESLVPVPPGWTDEQAGSATLVYLTAWQALSQWGLLPPSVVLVTGASGGVGVASVQLAKSLGHTVIALSRSAEKSKTLEDLGADITLNPHNADWRKQAREWLGQRRVDLVVENIGGELFNQVLDLMGMWGKISVVGRLAGPVTQFNTAALFFRRIRIGGVAVGTYTTAESRSAWADVLRHLDKTGAKPLVDRVFPFDQLPAAFARLAEGPMGKVLVRINV